jgi:hypothetical protein
MLFVTPSGEGVEIETARHRAKPRLTPDLRRLVRASSFARKTTLGICIADIAEIFGVSESTVHAELAYFRAERAKFETAYPLSVPA